MQNKINIPEYVLKTITQLGYKIKIEEGEGESKIIYIEDFSAYETEIPVSVRGLAENPHPTNKMWMVQGTRYSPPEIDLFDIKQVDSVVAAIREILYMLEKRKVDFYLEGNGVEEFVKEQEGMDEY